MKKSIVLKNIAWALQKRNTGHYSYNEQEHAKDILSVIEDLGILLPLEAEESSPSMPLAIKKAANK